MSPFLRILSAIVFVFCVHSSWATHMMGGNLGYEYLGQQPNGMFRYRIILKMYTNCGPDSDIPIPVNSFQVGIYYEDAANPNNNKVRHSTVTVVLTDSTRITPALPNNCTVGTNTCIIEGVYTTTVDLPSSFDGYHLYLHRCCRNGDIVNLNSPGTQGMAFHAFIPPTLVDNNTPVFSDLPLPFICVSDTTSILNTAYDPDGDKLIFSFVTPYNGGPYPNPTPPPPNPLTWTIPLVNYLGGYDKDNPFGAGGYAYINGSTGYTEFFCPSAGKYVVAVEIKEYRNNKLVGISRRDMQLLVINCPYNPAPKVSTTLGTGQTNFTITEGDSLCFNIAFYDELADSLILEVGGPVFDPLIINPPATVNSYVEGDSVVMTTFCWNTVCGQDQSLPYLFTVKATDNGCPPKATNQVYSIQINPFAGPTVINGSDNLCEGDSLVTYTVTNIPGATYTWTITGGTQVSGGNTNTITVNWGSSGVGNVKVTTTSSHGCLSDPVELPVSINPKPSVNAGNDKTICFGDSVSLGGAPTGPPGAIYSWSPASGLSSNSVSNPIANPADTTTYIVTVTGAGGCKQNDTVSVFVTRISVDAGADSVTCIMDSVQLGGAPTGPGGATFSWSPSTGISDTAVSNPFALPSGPVTYVVMVTDSNGCVNTDSITIGLDSAVVDAGSPLWVCPGDSVQLMASGGIVFAWSPSATLNDSTLSGPKAAPGDTTVYYVNVTNARGCSATDSVTVFVNSEVPVDAGANLTICAGDSVQIGAQPVAPSGTTFNWTPVAGLSDPAAANPMASPNVTTVYYVSATNDTCNGLDSVIVYVNQLPTADAGPDQEICTGQNAQLNGTGGITFAWTPALTLNDSTLSNPLATPADTTVYYLTVTDSNGCSKTDSVMVEVNPLPVVSAGADKEICTGQSTQLMATGGATFSWTPSLGLSDTSIFNPVASPADTIVYMVTATDSNGCKNTDTVSVIVNPLPVPNAGADTSVCIGGSVQLTGAGGVVFSWSPGTTLNDSTIFNPVSTPSDTIAYRLTVTDTNGCVNSDTVTVAVHPLPPADAGAGKAVCAGDSIQLTGSGGILYLWSPGNSLNDSTLSNPEALPPGSITYYLQVTDSNGCVNSDSVAVTVNTLPAADAGADREICAGKSAQLTGSGGGTYSWSPGGSLNDSTIFNPVATPGDTMIYYLTVTDSNGCKKTDSLQVVVNSLPVADAGPDSAICIGDSLQLNASGGVVFLWSPGGGLSDSTSNNPSAGPAATTTYFVNVTDSKGCSNNDSVIVTVHTLPAVDAGVDQSMCAGDSVQLTGTGGIAFIWSPGSTLNDSTLSGPLAGPSGTTTYYLLASDSNGCRNSDSITVQVNTLPPADAGADQEICLGGNAQLNGSGGGSYLWSPGASLNDSTVFNPVASPGDTTIYFLTVTDSNGCKKTDSAIVIVNPLPVADAGPDVQLCAGDSMQLNASGGITYSWSPSGGLSDTAVFNPWVGPALNRTYYVNVTDSNGCQNVDSVKITVHALPVVDAGPNAEICVGGNVQLIASGGVNYQWTPSAGLSDSLIYNPVAAPADTITYRVMGTDSNGCTNADCVTVIVNPLPPADAGNDVQLCRGDTVQLTGAGGVIYSWSPAGSLDNPGMATPHAFPQVTTTYLVTVTDTNGCVSSDSVTINVFRIYASSDTSLCEGDSVMLQVTGGGFTYTWSPVSGLSNTTISNPMTSPNGTITYTVTVVSATGCVEVDDVTVYVDQKPVADYDFTITPGCSGLQIACRNLSTNATSWLWDFGNGVTSTEMNPVIVFSYDQSYNVSLTAYNKQCYDQKITSHHIGDFEKYVGLQIPNIFTPNGDGVNDVFKTSLSTEFDDCTEFSIYNRWGTRIFSSAGKQPVWKGTTEKGREVPDGVYFYIIKLKEKEIRGHVTLLGGG